MTLIVPLPWCKRAWALPFLTVLAPSKKSNEKAGRRHKTSLDWTRQMVKVVTCWLKRPWILVGDGAYACMDLAIACIRYHVILISRLRLDAPKQNWQVGAVSWYGGEQREIEYHILSVPFIN